MIDLSNQFVNDWASHLGEIGKLQGPGLPHKWLTSETVDGSLQVQFDEAFPKPSVKLKLNEIIDISSRVFFASKEIDSKQSVINGLEKIYQIRDTKFNRLGVVCQFFSKLFGYDAKQQMLKGKIDQLTSSLTRQKQQIEIEKQRLLKEMQEKERIAQEEKAREEKEKARKETLSQDLSNHLMDPEFDGSGFDLTQFDSHLGHELEESLDLILKSTGGELVKEGKKMLFSLLFEKTAQCYLKENQLQEAIRVRIKGFDTLRPCLKFSQYCRLIQEDCRPPFDRFIDLLGAGSLKNHVVRGKVFKNNLNQNVVHLEGKLNVYAKEKVFLFLEKFRQNQQEFQQFFQDGAKVSIGEQTGFQLAVKGIGTFNIGPKETYCEANRFRVDLDSNPDLEGSEEKLYYLLSLVGLGEVAHTTRVQDLERIKIFQLFRAYYPANAYPFERSEKAFFMPTETLKTKMIASLNNYQQPTITKLFQDELPLMIPQEVHPNFKIWSIPNYSLKVKEKGAKCLMSGLGCIGYNPWAKKDSDVQVLMPFIQAAENVANIFKFGMFSTQDRQILGIKQQGASNSEDMRYGGGDSVFCRLLVTPWAERVKIKESIIFCGHIQILFKISLLDRIGYGFNHDYFGTKKFREFNSVDPYKERSNIIDLAQSLKDEYSGQWGNEVCVKSRIPSEYICGIQVQTENHKIQLIEVLKRHQLITLVNDGEQIQGRPVDEFIRVGNTFKAHLAALSS